MPQPWAHPFYRSPEWDRTRVAYGDSVHWLCERHQARGELVPGRVIHHKQHLTPASIHNAEVTLGWANLECLCMECHSDEHFPTTPATREGYAFDRHGDLVAAPTPPHSANE